MKNASTPESPAPMEGHGAYNRSSRVQAAGLSAAIPLLSEAAKSVALPPGDQPIVIADYGSSEGHNSLFPASTAIAALRARVEPTRAVLVVHTDLPSNDFSALFETLATDPESYLRGDAKIFASAVGRSFYEQILPSNSVTLGWSSWSVQWLSRTPAPIPDHVQIACSKDAAACSAYARQAAEDWRAFLTHRGQELRQGGRIVVLTMAKTDDGDFGYRLVLEALIGALADLVGEGIVSAAEMHRMAIPTVGRTRADFSAPFSDAGCFAGLAMESLDIFLEEDRIFEEYQRDGGAKTFAARWAAFVRASTFPTLALGLAEDAGDQRRAAFFDELEKRMVARLSASPERTVIPLASMVLVKTGQQVSACRAP